MHIYIFSPKLLRWNFLQILQLSIRSGGHTFPPIFGLFAIFDRNFAKIVALSSDEYENYVLHLKVKSPAKKTLHTASKSGNKRQRNACSNYAALERTVLRTRSVTNKQTNKLETKASSHEGQCIPAGSSVSPPKRVLTTVSIITMRSISR